MTQPFPEISSEVLIEKYASGDVATVHEVRARVARALASIVDVDAYSSIYDGLEEVLRERITRVGPRHWTRFTTLLNLLRWLQTLKLPLSAPTDEARSQTPNIPHPSLRPPARAPPATTSTDVPLPQ